MCENNIRAQLISPYTYLTISIYVYLICLLLPCKSKLVLHARSSRNNNGILTLVLQYINKYFINFNYRLILRNEIIFHIFKPYLFEDEF